MKRPKEIGKQITKYTKSKVPHFFIYAKDKKKHEVEPINNSVVNRLERIVPNLKTQFTSSGLGKFNYKMLMSNSDIELDQGIVDLYNELDLKSRMMIHKNAGWNDDFLLNYKDIREKLLALNSDVHYVSDVLIEYLYRYRKTDYKVTLWECFGDIIIENLRKNVEREIGKRIQCAACGIRIETTGNKKKYCDSCAKKIAQAQKNQWKKNNWKKNRQTL